MRAVDVALIVFAVANAGRAKGSSVENAFAGPHLSKL